MILNNRLYLVTDKTVDGLYELIDAAVKCLNEMDDKDAAIQLLFDAQDILVDTPAVPGIEGVDRPNPAFPGQIAKPANSR